MATDFSATSEAEQRFENFRHRAGFFLAPAAGVAVYFLTEGSLKPEGQRLAGILAFVAGLWLTEAIPIPIAGLLGAGLAVVLNVATAKAVLAPFADPIVFLFLGSFILAEAMMLHRLDRRFALNFLALPFIGGNPIRLLAGVGLVSGSLSMLVSNTATAAMMMPIAIGILTTLQDLKRARGEQTSSLREYSFATGMMLMIAYAASIGGIVTPVGSPPNLITIGLLKQNGIEITFLQWTCLCMPLFLMMFVALVLLLRVLHPPTTEGSVAGSEITDYIRKQRDELGPWTAGQINTLLAFSVAVLLWVGPGVLMPILGKEHPLMVFCNTRLPEAVAALIAASLLFFLPTNLKENKFTLTWQQASKIDWGTILLFGGGLSLGGLMESTGVARALGGSLTEMMGAQTLWTLTAVSTIIAIMLTEVTSNTAAANMVIPVVIALSKEADVNPVAPALGACLGASFAFMLPVSTPPNAIAYGSGLVPITKMVRAGVIYDAIGFVIIMVGLRVLCPLLGFA